MLWVVVPRRNDTRSSYTALFLKQNVFDYGLCHSKMLVFSESYPNAFLIVASQQNDSWS